MEEKKCSSFVQCRYIMVALVFFGFVNSLAMRVNLSVAIVAMAGKNKTTNLNGSDDTCPFDAADETKDENKEGEFDWDEFKKGMLLGSFFYSYVVMNILGGRMAELAGAKWTFGIGILFSSVLTMLTPIGARFSYGVLVALRVLGGAFEGLVLPSAHCILGKWFNKEERSFCYGIMHSGIPVGVVLGLLLSGFLCNSDFLGGWPSAFYVFGVLGLVWCVFWFFLMYEDPEKNPFITETELSRINEGRENYAKQDKPFPWTDIATSIPVWACSLSALTRMWSLNLVIYTMPLYLSDILHYDIEKSGMISSLPNFAEFILTVLSGYIADWILRKKLMPATPMRKLMNTIGLVPGMICMIIIPAVGCNKPVNILMLTLAVGFNGFCTSGYITAIVDMSPPYAGTLLGLINGLSHITGVLAPYTVGFMTHGNPTASQWYKIFYLTAGMNAVATAIFLFFGSSQLQKWSQEDERKSYELS